MAIEKNIKNKPSIKIKDSPRNTKTKIKNDKKSGKPEGSEGFAELLEYTRKKTLMR